MATSITHRATGVALSMGMALIAWGLISLASGPELYQPFIRSIGSPAGFVIFAGFLWALTYHFLNGIRHLAWDLGFGFEVRDANRTGLLVVVLSILMTIAMFGYGWWVLNGGRQV